MARILILSFFCALVACSAEGPVTEPTPVPARGESECNYKTPLVPGIPGSPGNLIKSPRNPNGDSELAYLMRQFIDDLEEVRKQAEAGGTVKKLYEKHRKMRCSWPTDPAERNEAFDLRAQTYLSAVKAFDAAPDRATYNAIISGCIACHSVSCRGPIDFISGMKW